jgi:hypothetical protein
VPSGLSGGIPRPGPDQIFPGLNIFDPDEVETPNRRAVSVGVTPISSLFSQFNKWNKICIIYLQLGYVEEKKSTGL